MIIGVVNLVSGELIVSCPEEVSRQMLESEATLLDSVERETECEAVTEREDTYEVIINGGAELKSEKYSIGMNKSHDLRYRMTDQQKYLIFSVEGGGHLFTWYQSKPGCPSLP